MLKSSKTNIIFLLATIAVLVVSLSWIDWIELVRHKWPVFKDSFVRQTMYVLTVTVIGILLVVKFKPFSTDSDTVITTGSERILQEQRAIRQLSTES
jgi:uncharacterized membrane protein YesL